MPTRGNPLKDLMEMNLRPPSQRIPDILPIECENVHSRLTLFSADDADRDPRVKGKTCSMENGSRCRTNARQRTQTGVQRENNTDFLQQLAEHPVEEAWNHPFTVREYRSGSQPAHQTGELGEGERTFPSGKPFIQRDQQVFGERVGMITLGNIHQQQSSLLQDTDVFPKEPFRMRLAEVLKKTLMEHDVERLVLEWKMEGISSEDHRPDLSFLGELLQDEE